MSKTARKLWMACTVMSVVVNSEDGEAMVRKAVEIKKGRERRRRKMGEWSTPSAVALG